MPRPAVSFASFATFCEKEGALNHQPRPLVRSLNHKRNRGLNRYTTQMLNGARRPAAPNYLSIACRLLSQYVRWRKKTLKEWNAREHEYRSMLEREKWEKEWSAALKKVYGPDALTS